MDADPEKDVGSYDSLHAIVVWMQPSGEDVVSYNWLQVPFCKPLCQPYGVGTADCCSYETTSPHMPIPPVVMAA